MRKILDRDPVVVDLILATRRPAMTGVERYGLQILNALAAVHPNVIALVGEGADVRTAARTLRMPASLSSWLLLPLWLRRQGLGRARVLFPSFPASPGFRASRNRTFRVIHDAFPWTRPGSASLKSQLMFRHAEQAMLGRHEGVFAPTEPVAEELRSLLPRKDIAVIGNAVGISTSGERRPVARLEGTTFALAVGTVEPRKNYARVASVAPSLAAAGCRMVVAGRRGWGEDIALLDQAARDPAQSLIWLDNADDAEMRWLYDHAACFVSLSHAEGFNMPLVEAGTLGAPIVCSDIAIHHVVAPPWACFIPPEAGADAVRQAILQNAALGKQNPQLYASRYSWDAIANNILDLIDVAH